MHNPAIMPLPDEEAYLVECVYCGFLIYVSYEHLATYDRIGCMQCNKAFDVGNVFEDDGT